MKMRYLICTLLFTLAPGVFAEEPDSGEPIKVPKEQWLANLRDILPEQLCMPESPMMQVYKGKNCQADMLGLYNQCVSNEPSVVIPAHLTSVEQANMLGQVLTECMVAHYQGGAALNDFKMMQSMNNKSQ
jgi:hypothetical protein